MVSGEPDGADYYSLTHPMPTSRVELSAENTACLNRVSEMWTPVVLENPGLEACPPDMTANGVLEQPISCICTLGDRG